MWGLGEQGGREMGDWWGRGGVWRAAVLGARRPGEIGSHLQTSVSPGLTCFEPGQHPLFLHQTSSAPSPQSVVGWAVG